MKFPRPFKKLRNDCIVPLKHNNGLRTTSNDYVRIGWRGDSWGAHRLSYHLNVEPIPVWPRSRKSGHVLHICDCKNCINPKHLCLGTHKQNMTEMSERSFAFKAHIESRKGVKRSVEICRKISIGRKAVGNGPWTKKQRQANIASWTKERRQQHSKIMKQYYGSL